MSLGLLIAAVVVPRFLSPFPLSVLMLIVIFAILAMSLDLLMGYTGMESLGQAAFFGMAAYTVAILSTRYDIGWETGDTGRFVWRASLWRRSAAALAVR